MARVSKSEWIEQKKAEKQEMENKLSGFLKTALETKDGMDDLIAHYRISGLYTYSFLNCLMIHMQGGTIAQSYGKWKKLGRTVNKGQKSHIRVYCPMFKKEKKLDGTTEDVLIGFKLVPVFDVEQTDGKALEYDHNSEDMDVPYSKVKAAIEAVTDAKVVEAFTGTARGWSDGKNLTVSQMSNDADKAKTMIHEAAHHLIHTGKDAEKDRVSSEAREVEAESVAYLVMSYLGMDYDLSEKYVANYKHGIGEARHRVIIRTADKLIKAMKKEISEEDLFLAKV